MGNYSEISDPFPNNLLQWSKEYGEVFKFQFIGEIIVVVNNEQAIKVNKNIALKNWDV